MKKYFCVIALSNFICTSHLFAMKAPKLNVDAELVRTYEDEKTKTWDSRRDFHNLERTLKSEESKKESKLNALSEAEVNKLKWHHGAVATAVKATVDKYKEARQAIHENNGSKLENCLKDATDRAEKLRKELLDYKNNVKEILQIDIDARARL